MLAISKVAETLLHNVPNSTPPTYVASCRVLPTLEFLPLLPTQQNLDSLQAFLDPLPNSPVAVQASRARLVAKLQHQLQWVNEHLQAGSELCQVASQLASTTTAT